MKQRYQILGLFLCGVLLCACSAKQAQSSASSQPVASSAKVSVKKSSTNSDRKIAMKDDTVAADDERTEPNPPLPPEIAEKLMKGEIGESPTGGPFKRLPVTPQLQEVWYYCAPTTVSMMLSSQGQSISQHQLAKEMGTYEPYGTHNRDAIRVLNQHLFGYETPADGQAGYRLATVTDASKNSEDMRLFKERVKKNIDDGYPLYYTFNVEQIYPGKKGEHNVIGIGYELTPDGKDISGIYYLDPGKNVQDPTYGGLKKVTPEELLSAMVTCGEPNYAW